MVGGQFASAQSIIHHISVIPQRSCTVVSLTTSPYIVIIAMNRILPTTDVGQQIWTRRARHHNCHATLRHAKSRRT